MCDSYFRALAIQLSAWIVIINTLCFCIKEAPLPRFSHFRCSEMSSWSGSWIHKSPVLKGNKTINPYRCWVWEGSVSSSDLQSQVLPISEHQGFSPAQHLLNDVAWTYYWYSQDDYGLDPWDTKKFETYIYTSRDF